MRHDSDFRPIAAQQFLHQAHTSMRWRILESSIVTWFIERPREESSFYVNRHMVMDAMPHSTSSTSLRFTRGRADLTLRPVKYLTGKIGLIGDVHQEDRYLQRTLERLADLDVHDILCTGDIVDGEGNADNAIRLLTDTGVYAVRGNHDRWFLLGTMRDLPDALPTEQLNHEHRKWLERRPRSLRFETPAGSLLLCHGLGDSDMATLLPDDEGYAIEVNDQLHSLIRDPDVDIVVAGHTHRRMVRHFDGLTVIRLQRTGFDHILAEAVHSSSIPERYESHEAWQQRVKPPVCGSSGAPIMTHTVASSNDALSSLACAAQPSNDAPRSGRSASKTSPSNAANRQSTSARGASTH